MILPRIRENKMSILNNTQEDAPKDKAFIITNRDSDTFLAETGLGASITTYLSSALFFCSREDAVCKMVGNSIYCKQHGLVYVQSIKQDEFSLYQIF